MGSVWKGLILGSLLTNNLLMTSSKSLEHTNSITKELMLGGLLRL